ncbi:hypothetical protein [Noviluteimonas gilva]|uniref:Uncharacterized protein n=1 Tax=Noviluteimonas gilva TaxID=2682097 RepID=A0A7C9LKP4_9GAMM|nr:hypothetical protein [Lysobacter gilvus]MUV15679.1 hypothetical protein [Lysobacter gilvus]
MYSYTIDDAIESPMTCTVDVTIDFPSGKRWLFFATPELLATVGDFVEGSQVRVHLGEKHMIVVSELTPAVIDAVLRDLMRQGDLERRTLPFSDD